MHMSVAIGYCRDRVFLVSLLGYCLNKAGLLSYHVTGDRFFSCHFNDLLLVPVLLPMVLLASRVINVRKHDNPPSILEVAIGVSVWSLAFEYVGPRFFGLGTADPLDALAYAVGGGISWLIWNKGQPLNSVDGAHLTRLIG